MVPRPVTLQDGQDDYGNLAGPYGRPPSGYAVRASAAVSDDPAMPPSGPFGDLLRDLARLLTSQGPLNWEVARQLALWTATEGEAEPNVDPLARIRTEEVLRVAEMHVAETTGMATSRRGWLSLSCVTRAGWASSTLGSWKEPMERLAGSLTSPQSDQPPEGSGAMDQLIGNLPQVVGPLVLGAQVGTMVGHLASRALGQYDVAMPAPASDELLSVPASVDAFAAEWGLSADDLRMFICLRDVAHHAVLRRPHVAELLRSHLLAYAAAFHVDMDAVERRLGAVDPSDLMSFQASLGDPEAFLGELQTDEQRRLLARFRAFQAALAGYTDFVTEKVGRTLVGDYAMIAEALRRHRLEDGPGQRALGKLLGVELDRETVESGHAFIAGVLERAGDEGLALLWSEASTLPTPAEIEAPGLWLARIELAG